MAEPISTPITRTLMACAVFQTFDQAALCAVLELDAETAAAVLGSDAVEPVAQASGVYQLRPAAHLALLDQLRRTRPRDEHALHRRAFDYYLRRLQEPAPTPPDLIEAACMHHLRELRILNMHYMRYEDVATMLAGIRATHPNLHPHHAAEIAVFDAYNAFRRQQYSHSAALLRDVLQQPDLPPRLHAEALITRGVSEMNQAHLDLALADLEQALVIGVQIDDHGVQGRALINQSWIYNQLHQFEMALRLGQRSLENFQHAHDLYLAAYALYNIGNNALYLGRWDLGQRHLDQAAAIYEPAGMAAQLALVDWARGFLHQILGDEAASEQAYLRALAVAESAEFANVVTATDTLTELGLLYQIQQRWERAAATLIRAIALAEQLGDDLRKVLLMHRYSRLLSQQKQSDAALHTLATAIDALETLRVSTKTEEIKIGLLGTTQQVYESIILALLDRGDSPAAFAYVERARARAFLDLVARRGAPIDAALTHPTVGLDELQARLAPDALVLEYYTVGVIPPGDDFLAKIPAENTRLRAHLTVPPEIVLFAVTATTLEVHRIAVDPNLLQPPPDDPIPGWHLLTERKLSWLYTKLLAPVEHLLAQRRVLHIIPHGPLHYVPFAALRTSDGGTLLMPGGPAVTSAPSATLLCTCLDQQANVETLTLALGYDDRDATALFFAEAEARLVGQLTNGIVYVGAGPKSADLLALGPRLRALHIAGHAVYQPDDPLGSFLLLGEGDRIDARTLMRDLKLTAALTTLNACASGLSQVASGDELLGLPRAFLYAGAATIICTLHEVDDLAAYMLMVSFYENLAHGQSPARALHQAQIALRTQPRDEVAALIQRTFDDDTHALLPSLDDYDPIPFAHPRYWAPFIVIGKP